MASPNPRIFVDESGDHVYSKVNTVNSRYLGLLGVIFDRNDGYITMADQMDAMKRNIFGPRPDDPVILHRSEIIDKRGPFSVLRSPELEGRFNASLLELYGQAQFRMICVVIDKLNHQFRYHNPVHPYHYCMAALMERYCLWLEQFKLRGDVLAESRDKNADIELKKAYAEFHAEGTQYVGSERAQDVLTSKELKIKKKEANIPGLQFCDLIAQPMKQWVLWKCGIINEPTGFSGQLARLAALKFRQYGTTTKGFGWCCLSFP